MQNPWIARAAADARVADLRRDAEAYRLRSSDRRPLRPPRRLRTWAGRIGGRPRFVSATAAAGRVAPRIKEAPGALTRLLLR